MFFRSVIRVVFRYCTPFSRIPRSHRSVVDEREQGERNGIGPRRLAKQRRERFRRLSRPVPLERLVDPVGHVVQGLGKLEEVVNADPSA
jgi:hypothetical protein